MAGGFRHVSVERRPINELEEWGSRREVVSIIELTAIDTVYISSSDSARAINKLHNPVTGMQSNPTQKTYRSKLAPC